MAINSEVRNNQNILEYGKFVEIVNDSNFPPLTTVRSEYKDSGTLYTETYVYPKYALLTYDINSAQVNGSPFGDNSSLDSFGRLRTSNSYTLFDSKLLYGKAPQFFDEVVGGTGDSIFVQRDSLVTMTTTSSGDYVIRQSRSQFNYQPGKGIQAMFTGVFAPQTNIVKRVGMFQGLSAAPYTPKDGIYLEVTENGPSFVVTKTEGTTLSYNVPQSAWNIDKFDGSGASGITIDFTKAQLFTMDYEWLGVGRIRMGFYLNGRPYYGHVFTNLNALSAPYISSPNQPVRYEIRQTGTSITGGSLKQICSTVNIEGGEDDIGSLATVTMSAAVANNAPSTGFSPVIALRINPNNVNVVALIKSLELYNDISNSAVVYKLIQNPTITPAPTFLPVDNTPNLQFSVLDPATHSYSGGYDMVSGYVAQKGSPSQFDIPRATARLGSAINGTPDIFLIAAKALTNTGNFFAGFNCLVRA